MVQPNCEIESLATGSKEVVQSNSLEPFCPTNLQEEDLVELNERQKSEFEAFDSKVCTIARCMNIDDRNAHQTHRNYNLRQPLTLISCSRPTPNLMCLFSTYLSLLKYTAYYTLVGYPLIPDIPMWTRGEWRQLSEDLRKKNKDPGYQMANLRGIMRCARISDSQYSQLESK